MVALQRMYPRGLEEPLGGTQPAVFLKDKNKLPLPSILQWH